MSHAWQFRRKKFAGLAPSRRVFRRWGLAHDWNRNVGSAGSRNCFYTLDLAILATEFLWARKWLATASQWLRGRFRKIRLERRTDVKTGDARIETSGETVISERRPIIDAMFAPKFATVIGAAFETKNAVEHITAAAAMQPAISVVTGMNFAVHAEAAWAGLVFYEQIEKRPPWFLCLVLPAPIRADIRELEVGNEIKCHYSGGHLVKRVTRVNRGWHYAFEIIEQNLTLGRGIRLLGGSYTLRALPGGRTEVALETRYVSPNRPRCVCEPIEMAVCHLFHRHILSAMRAELESLAPNSTPK
jgi:hypothetical protein